MNFIEDPNNFCNADDNLPRQLCAPAMEEGLQTIKAIIPVLSHADAGCEHAFA